jgi:23S rRNA U2552 (ribose-2'-O)-methylase RlmE/FtsJ
MKVLEGSAMPQLLADARKLFGRVKPFKPEASRRESTEIFVIAHDYKGPPEDGITESAAPTGPPAIPEGW